jgi:PD-(D/E)XK nuclease superfamily protein
MELSPRSKSYMIPEYSLTGDLLSFLTCNLQYRYQNRGTLPPSMPIQLWFGEFIHGVMEEAFLKWENNKIEFPWNWKNHIRPIEEMIDLRLRARGLYPPLDFFCRYQKGDDGNMGSCLDNNHPHKLLYSARAESAINIWGPDLFPLIDSAEVLIKGKRLMPNFNEKKSRSNYYGINGVIDVISSLKINECEANNIIKHLNKNEEFSKIINSLDSNEYEIIIDYKGMKRPSFGSKNWIRHEWQLLTYAWLRSKQEDSKPIIAGIIFYLNELVPSTEDLIAIQQDIISNNNDVELDEEEKAKILNWREENTYINLSKNFRKNRSIRTLIIEDKSIFNALNKFDDVVADIEKSILNEMDGVPIKSAWDAKGDERTCDACDFKGFCSKSHLDSMKIP